MKMASPKRLGLGHRNDAGFALLMVVFMTTLLLIVAIVAAPSIRTEKQREKEQEMIWRGKQYVRGVKLFYRKNGRFPTSLDDLTKPKTGTLRFMRQAYKDPMNGQDGSWRLIYVGPTGQLIGSLKPPQTLQIPGVGGSQPGSAAAAGTQQQVSFGASGFGQTPPAQGGAGTTTQGGAGQQGASGSNPPAPGASAADDGTLPASAITADNPIIGGNIIGVGSKVNKRSVIVYDKAKNYRLFEFVWNPSKDLANAINQTGTQIGTPNAPGQGIAPGAGGFGQPLGNPAGAAPTPQPGPVPAPPQPPQL
jgi:hypothetical protein